MSYASLVALLVVDVVALISFLIVQVFGAPMPIAWVSAGILAGMAAPALLRLVDRVFAAAREGMTIPQAGESFL